MGNKFKFDVVIGNPPYQEETDSKSTRMPPIYNYFMDQAYQIAKQVELITPARFLFNAGYTPSIWNKKMLQDKHLKVVYYEPESEKVFPNITDIKGGIAVTYRDESKDFGAIGMFTKFPDLNVILKKVQKQKPLSIMNIISSPLSFQVTDKMKKEHPELVNRLRTNAFEALSGIFYIEKPDDGLKYIQMIGLFKIKRTKRYIREDYIIDKAKTLNKWCVLLPKANGTGNFGEKLSAPILAGPGIAYTQTFIGIGATSSEKEAKNIIQYIKTKFVRAMLGVLKITQDNPGPKWKMVPLQDFTSSSDIDWSKSIREIDQQLYKKYKLSPGEIDFIESHVKEME